MNILYIASTCTRKKYTEYIESRGARVSQQAQKYNLLLAEGLADNGVKVRMISTRPINRRVTSQFWFQSEKEMENGVDFSYIPFANYPILRNLFVLWGVFTQILFSKGNRKNTVVVCDALNIVASLAALLAGGLRGYCTVGIVTDVPCHFSNMDKIPFSQKLNLWIMRRFKSYLLLTEPMSDVVNPHKRPYLVLEGHSDLYMADVENRLQEKMTPYVCMYAGSLMKVYGIQSLVEGFVQADIPNTQLHIYGDGDYVEELKELVKSHPNVKYLGIAPNAQIVKAELEATLLINPRPTNEEYTQYSFPSKNMEYMASGTAVLTTRLPGMPRDHAPYVYFIEKETPEGIAEALTRIFSQTPEQIHAFGMSAKAFVMEHKNNVSQARKLLQMLQEQLGGTF